MLRKHQELPAKGTEREALRQKGQFWTPDWVADATATYVLRDNPDRVLDPAVGSGAFFQAVRRVANADHPLVLHGHEIDADILLEAQRGGTAPSDLRNIALRDFVGEPPGDTFPAIIANPPYLRHHRILAETKAQLKRFATSLLGKPLDGRAGLHVYFLLRALTLLAPGGRLAFILPADTCEGKFATDLWQFITQRFRVDAVVSFDSAATPFPSVDTNALVFCLRNAAPRPTFAGVRCAEAWTNDLCDYMTDATVGKTIAVQERQLTEALESGFSRGVQLKREEGEPVLGDFARVMRGIATGDNDFFFLTASQVETLALPKSFLRRAVGRTRDVQSDVLTTEHLECLDAKQRPTFLLSPDDRPLAEFPKSLRDYLAEGERRGLPLRALISQRSPWYRMERREIPPFLFAYLGRRDSRFIRNNACALPLTSFLCVYPRQSDPAFLRGLWNVLSDPLTLAGLPLVGKSYGSGAIKVEPRSLEKLWLPPDLLEANGLFTPRLLLEPGANYVAD